MEWLNYHHLLYFWVVAKEGSIARACEKLLLAQPTISGQIRALEKQIGEKLFDRVGRRLQLTDTGRVVFRYAEEIFSLGQELQDVMKGRPADSSLRLNVGIADALPKFLSYRILQPALKLPQRVQLICREGSNDELLAKLALHELDLVLADAPVSATTKIRAYNHLLGECDVSVFGTQEMYDLYRRGFPRSLHNVPWLLPTDNTALRRSLNRWFESEGVHPVVAGEFEDSSLMKVFCVSGLGVIPCPSATEKEIRKYLDLKVIGHIAAVKERFYAITIERRLRNPAVLAICESARERIFS